MASLPQYKRLHVLRGQGDSRREEDAGKTFLTRHSTKIIGVLSGFDRIVFL